jgi:hypothetical protein
MPAFTYALLYVADVPASATLYARLLDLAPVESAPTFALFVMPNGFKLGLWARHEIEPRATLPGGSELCIALDSDEAVRAARDAWVGLGLRILQEPTNMDFGYTFTAADMDGHRLRVFRPS